MSDLTFFKHQKGVFSAVFDEAQKAVEEKRLEQASIKLHEIDRLMEDYKAKVAHVKHLLTTLKQELSFNKQQLQQHLVSEIKDILIDKIEQTKIDIAYIENALSEQLPDDAIKEYEIMLNKLKADLHRLKL